MLSHKILELRVSADDHLCLQAVCGIGDPWPSDASRPVSGRRNRTVGSIDVPEHDPMLTSMIGRLRPSAAGSPCVGSAATSCKVRLGLLVARDMTLFLATLFIWGPYANIQAFG